MIISKITVKGLNRVTGGLESLTTHIKNLSQSHSAKIGNVVKKDIDERFETAGRGTWEPNRIITLRRKSGNRPLIDTGIMRNSIKVTIESNEIKVSVPYAGISRNRTIPIRHQMGRNVPKRKIVDADSIDLHNALDDVVNSIIEEIIKEAFK